VGRFGSELIGLIQSKMVANPNKEKKPEPAGIKMNFMDQPMTLGKTKKKKTPKNEKLLVVDRSTDLPSFEVAIAEKSQPSKIFNEHFEQHQTHNEKLLKLQEDLVSESVNYMQLFNALTGNRIRMLVPAVEEAV